jgi:tetratricopeptide (TPR) repeat protein
LLTLTHTGDRAALEVALGNLALREQDLAAATNAFNLALKLDSKFAAANAAVGALAWARGDVKSAAAYFQAAADVSPVRSPRRLQNARFKAQTGDLPGARAALAEILKTAPDYMPASLLLAEIAFSEKKYDECAGLLGDVQKLDPGNYDAMQFQARLDEAQAKSGLAVTDMERMVRSYGKVPSVQFQMGMAFMADHQPTKAAASFEQALKLNPDFAEATLRLAEIQIQTGNAEAAIAILDPLRHKHPDLVAAQLMLADAYRMRNRVNEALALYQAVETKYPTNAEVALLHASALFQIKDVAGARKAYERVLQLVPGYLPAIEALMDLSLAEKNFDAATELINREIQKDPKRVPLRLVAANNLLAQGKRDQAEAALQQALEIEPTNQPAALSLAQAYAGGGQFDKAQARLNAVLAVNATNISAYMLLAQIQTSTSNFQAAAEAYEKLLKIDPQYSPALNNLAYLYAENLNNLDRAYELAQHARQLLPANPATADTLGWITFKRGSYEAALELLKESADKMKPIPDVQFHLGMAAYMMGDEATARAALQRAWQGTNFPGRAECQVCLSVLDLSPATADAAARALLQQRVAQKGGDPVALQRLARIYQREGNPDQAIAAYESLHQALPKNVDALVNLARLEAAKDLPKAYELAKAASKLAPDDPQVPPTLGHLAFQSGDYALADSVLQHALQSQPNNAALLFNFAQAAYAVGKVAETQTALQKAVGLNLPTAEAAQARRMSDLIALAANPAQAAAAAARLADILKTEPDDVPALMARAAASESTADRAAAEQACEKALARYPKFVPAQQQLARLYAADGKLERASALAQQAHDALPDDATSAKMLGAILVQRGEYTRALTLLKQGAFKLTADPEVEYYLGSAQFHLNHRTESKASLQSALALKLSGPLAESARQMLAELK